MIHVIGQWDTPYKGSSGSDGQFTTLDGIGGALQWTLEQGFDTATLHDDKRNRTAELIEKGGVYGYRFNDGSFAPLVNEVQNG